MNRTQITTVAVGALTFVIYLATGGNVARQNQFLGDAGYSGATHVATCPVRISDECLAIAIDAGVSIHRFETLRFPIAQVVMADGGRDIQLPPMNQNVRNCVEVIDWSACGLATAGTFPAVAAKWGNAIPFAITGSPKPCVRQKADAGLTCLKLLSDGGSFDYGDRNVYARSEAVSPATCEQVACGILSGDDENNDL